MGEMRYTTNKGNAVQFDEGGDWGCLCTFPHNDDVAGKKLYKGRIASLALLGAAVAIGANSPNKLDGDYLPHCVPKWIRDEIEKTLFSGIDELRILDILRDLDIALTRLAKSDSSIEYAIHIREEFDNVADKFSLLKMELGECIKDSHWYFR